jgi:hypothetical protein
MAEVSSEVGVIVTLVERFEHQRLPRVHDLKQKVEEGELLTESEMAYLDEIITDAMKNKPLIDRHPEWQRFCAEVVHLYNEITERALENEKRARNPLP